MIYLVHQERWDRDIEKEYREIFDHYSKESDVPSFWKGDPERELERLVKNGVEILNGYRGHLENLLAEVLYSEVKFRVKIVGEVFTGTIDLVRFNSEGSLELIDFKSNRQKPTEAFLKNDWQLTL